MGVVRGLSILERDPEKSVPAFPRRLCSNKKIEQDDDSKKGRPVPVGARPAYWGAAATGAGTATARTRLEGANRDRLCAGDVPRLTGQNASCSAFPL
jgi:hypothetical protein